MEKAYKVMFMPDGTNIEYTVSGHGPGILVIHGSQRVDSELEPLIEGLSATNTVYYMDRRGWGGVDGNSGPKGADYSISKECQDVIAILKRHNIDIVFGDEYGSVIALHVIKQYPIKKALLLEPYLVSKRPLKWLPKMSRQVRRQKPFDAIVTYYKGEKSGVKWFPRCILKLMFKHTDFSIDRKKQMLYSTVVPEDSRLRKRKRSIESRDWKRRQAMMRELPAEIQAASAVENSFDAACSAETKIRFLYESECEPYIISSIRHLEGRFKNSEVIAVYSGDSMPVQDTQDKALSIYVAITSFLQED